MSIKDLFNNYKSNQFKPTESELSASKLVESNDFIEEKTVEKFRYVPPIDFSTASNFAKFGSAELYYEYAFKRIYQQYPYDGTLAEKQAFLNNSTFLDKYVFDNIYPRTNGHVIFSSDGWGTQLSMADGYGRTNNQQYITVLGGPHTASGGMEGKALVSTFEHSMIYDTTKKRAGSFEWNPVSGSTIEFWMKKDNFITGSTEKEVIIDIWNQEGTGSNSYGRIRLELTGAANGVGPLRLTMLSGTTGFQWRDICPSSLTTASVADGKWHHYAVTFNSDTDTVINLYRDGTYLNTTTISSTAIGAIENVSGGVNAFLGALQTEASGTTSGVGYGKLSASLDEFKFWKTKRTTNEIGEFWFLDYGGGTNDAIHNKELGVYLKFNEGITTNSSIDSTCLDYSGRISNGVWTGYTASARSVDSGLVLSGFVDKEFKDPIIYSSHPTVSSSLATYKASGSVQDYENTSLLYHLMPSWITEEDYENGQNLRHLTQIMASYFDTLYAQVSGLTSFKEKRYYSGSLKANTYSKEVLRGAGFVVPNLFVEAKLIEEFRNKDDNEIYDNDIQEIKNLIYQNIYNNLNYIYSSKGTEKSFRNFFRCFGVDSELIKLNLYSDNSTYLFRDNYEFTSIAKPVANFNRENQLVATVYQSSSDGLTYLSSSEGNDEQYTSFTMECEVIFPKKFNKSSPNYFTTGFTTGSIFGFHRAKTSSASDFAWHSSDTTLRIYAIRDEIDSKNVTFKLSGSSINLTSSLYTDVYNNEKWILAARLKSSKYPYVGLPTGSTTGNSYILEFYGVNSQANDVKNQFTVTKSVTNTVGKNLLSHAKRIYAGAHRTNYTGSVVEKTDVKVSQVRYWQSYLDNEEIAEHSYDPTNYGLKHPYRQDAPFQLGTNETIYVPQIETLALHWNFMNVTSSDSSGEFFVEDISSGSISESAKFSTIGKITRRKYGGRGRFFETSTTNAVDKEFIYAARKKMPDVVYSSDGVKIKSRDTEFIFQDDDVSDHFYSFEKSPYNAVSDQIINFFGSMRDFNSLIGDPSERYRVDYKGLKDLAITFFNRVENIPDPEKFFEYFKWIDTSISQAISQLIPASSRFANSVKNIVESHALERNKYHEKFPLVARQTSTEGMIKSYSEANYNWKFGHAPLDGNDNKNCLWQKTRRRVSNTNTQALRNKIYKSNNIETNTLFDFATSVTYQGNTDALLRQNKPYKLKFELIKPVHGGTNYYIGKNRDYIFEVTHPHGPVTAAGVPKNVLVVGAGVGQGLTPETICEDIEKPGQKEKYNFEAVDGRYSSNQISAPISDFASHKFNVKGAMATPFNIMSQSNAVSTGYQASVTSNFKNSAYITNIHSDTTDFTNEIPMQGVYTKTHVGGHQHRHVKLNKYDTTLFDADSNGAPSFSTSTPSTFSNASIVVVTASISAGTNFAINDGINTVTFEIDRDNDGVTAGRTSILTGSSLSEFGNNMKTAIANSSLFFGDVSLTLGSGQFTISLTAAAAGTVRNISFPIGSADLTLTANPASNGTTTTFTRFIDNQYTRPEAWRLLFGENPYQSVVDGALGLAPPDYGVASGSGIYPDTSRHRASYYREERAKRPISVKNIKHNSADNIVGNYSKNHEVIMMCGRKENNFYYRDNSTITNYLPQIFTASLPHTTHVMSLLGISPSESGSVFGVHENNRQPDGGIISAEVPGTPANGSFRVTGSTINGTTAQGTFRVSSRDFVTNGHSITIARTSPSETDSFAINAANSSENVASTGSSITQFYTNIRNQINAQSSYTSGFSATNPTFGTGIWNNGTSDGTFLSGTFSADHWGDPARNAWSCAFWMYLSASDTPASTGCIFTEKASSGTIDIRKVFVNSSDELVYEKYFINSGSPPVTASWSGSIPADLRDKWSHFVITQNAQEDVTGSSAIPTVHIMFNGNSSTALTPSYNVGPDNITGTPSPSGDFLVYSDKVMKSLKCGLDEFSLWDKELTSADRNGLYNSGVYVARTSVSSSNLKAWFQFGDDGYIQAGNGTYDLDGSRTLTDADLLHERQSNQFLTASEVGTELYFVDSIYETTGSALFTVQGATTGSNFNGTITVTTGSSFYSPVNITGGTNRSGASDGNTIVINGITFELDSDSSVSDTPTLKGIDCSHGTSNSNFWNALSQSIINNTVYDTVTYTSTTGFATFALTSSTTGSALNVAITETGDSFTNLVGMQSGSDRIPAVFSPLDVVIELPDFLLNNNKNETVIATRFAAPGGIEIESPAYLDIYAREYSVHNALPFRNMTVRGVKVKISGSAAVGGSGEPTTIRVVDHLGNRDGLKALLTRPSGRFGVDSVYGTVSANDYNASASFVKQHRNISRRMEFSGTSIITGSNYDNGWINSSLPRSEFQYSWINSALSHSSSPSWRNSQRILGYAPVNGIVSSSSGYVEAINFPSSSLIT